jgi:hypothetical protein
MPPHNDPKRNWILGFLRDYAIVIPTGVAVMNGLLAAYSTHYPFESPPAKISFIVIIGLLSFAAISAASYSQYWIVSGRAKERARIITIQETLGAFMVDGNQFLRRFLDSNDTSVDDDANQWLRRVGTFLIKELGQTYLARFQNSSGAPTVVPAGEAITNDMRKKWVYINQRLARLEQFIAEGPHAW